MAFSEEPTEEKVSLLQDMFGIARAEAIKRLKANNNDVEAATNEFLDDPQGTKYAWNEAFFNTDREGEANETGISFNIQGADELPPASHVKSVAPTRPPSRANNRSPIGPANTTQEDADLARAIAESAAESGIAPQEVGVMDHETSAKHFGPANRPEYDSEMWAMVPTKVKMEHEAADPPASNRKRDADAPAFLRQTKDHRLGALLSIYSKIPLVRNLLLRCGRSAPTYGYNAEWWKGSPILTQDVLAKMARGEEVWGEDTHPEFIDELHRLVAFLDQSERSYANVDSLAETKAIDENFGSWSLDVEDRLFQALHDASLRSPDCGIERMLTTGKVLSVMPPSPNRSEPDGQDEEDESTTSFLFLDIVLDSDSYNCVETLYDALDHLLWSSALSLNYTFPHDAKTMVLLNLGEVFTLRLGGPGLVKPCEIPAVFYADRYMNERKELALHFQTQIRDIKEAFKKLAALEEERVYCAGQLCGFSLQGLDRRHDIRECSTRMIKYAEHLIERQRRDAQWRQFQGQWQNGTPYSMDDLRSIHTWSGSSDFTNDEGIDQERWQYIIQVCGDKINDANRALAECEQKKQELDRYLDVVRKRLTCQEHEVDDDLFVFRSHGGAYRPEYWDPSAKYLLRGVATTSEVAYVCVRDGVNTTDSGESPETRDQWWKIGYVKSDASPIKSEKVTLDDVLSAAGTESKNPLLVYASEAALHEEKIPLSDALRMFVKADNRSFQQELAQEASIRETRDQHPVIHLQDGPTLGVTAEALARISSEAKGKRKHSAGSSVATNGSIRSDLADVELTFGDPQTMWNASGKPSHQDSSRRSSQIYEVEPLAMGRADEHRTPENVEEGGGKRVEGQSQETGQGLDADAEPTPKMPEMSERVGVGNPFRGANPLLPPRPSNPVLDPVDNMDLDTTEHGLGDG
ncbi:hypothetical protein F5Y14DRAFT_427208 [Nemania sp. NC0429]|nr:hypothetical protein F5Y14DRAFT_427208 [Nemania sp. NC0429]